MPDGQLYVNLQGATAGLQLLDPLEALSGFLRALGVQGDQVSASVGEAAARFRPGAAARRLLMVLDHARDAAQVAPLLPGAKGYAVLVTSRQVLATLSGATHLRLDVLPIEEAVALLGALAGLARAAGAGQWSLSNAEGRTARDG